MEHKPRASIALRASRMGFLASIEKRAGVYPFRVPAGVLGRSQGMKKARVFSGLDVSNI